MSQINFDDTIKTPFAVFYQTACPFMNEKHRCCPVITMFMKNMILFRFTFRAVHSEHHDWAPHYNDVIMSTMASQITSLTIVYTTVYSGADQRKHQSSASLAFVRGYSPMTGELPAQRASNAGNVSIWWRHHVSSRQYKEVLPPYLVNYRNHVIGSELIETLWNWTQASTMLPPRPLLNFISIAIVLKVELQVDRVTTEWISENILDVHHYRLQ